MAEWPDKTCGELVALAFLLNTQVDALMVGGYQSVDVDSLRVGIKQIATREDLAGLVSELLAHLETVAQRKAETGGAQ